MDWIPIGAISHNLIGGGREKSFDHCQFGIILVTDILDFIPESSENLQIRAKVLMDVAQIEGFRVDDLHLSQDAACFFGAIHFLCQ